MSQARKVSVLFQNFWITHCTDKKSNIHSAALRDSDSFLIFLQVQILNSYCLCQQVCPLQYFSYQTESFTGWSLQQSRKCLQRKGTASGGIRKLQTCGAVETRLHWWLHQFGSCLGCSRRHGTSCTSICYCSAVQPSMCNFSYLFSFVTISSWHCYHFWTLSGTIIVSAMKN